MFAQSKVSLNPPHIWHKYYRFPLILLILACLVWAGANGYAQDEADELTIEVFPVPARSRPNGIAPAPNGTVWYTAQALGELGVLDPETGDTYHIPLGRFSAPFSVITGPDGAAWITDSGLNAIVRVDGETEEVTVYPLPEDSPGTRLNSAVFNHDGILWFTGQNGIYGRLDPQTGAIEVFPAPRGRGPYGITATPDGSIYYASFGGSYVGHVDTETGEVTVLEPPNQIQGARRIRSDSQGRIWVSEWNTGSVSMYNPANEEWQTWRVPSSNPRIYAVYVDENDIVWLSDVGDNAIVRFDPVTEAFTMLPLPSDGSNVWQISGRPGEVWAAAARTDEILVIHTAKREEDSVGE